MTATITKCTGVELIFNMTDFANDAVLHNLNISGQTKLKQCTTLYCPEGLCERKTAKYVDSSQPTPAAF